MEKESRFHIYLIRFTFSFSDFSISPLTLVDLPSHSIPHEITNLNKVPKKKEKSFSQRGRQTIKRHQSYVSELEFASNDHMTRGTAQNHGQRSLGGQSGPPVLAGTFRRRQAPIGRQRVNIPIQLLLHQDRRIKIRQGLRDAPDLDGLIEAPAVNDPPPISIQRLTILLHGQALDWARVPR